MYVFKEIVKSRQPDQKRNFCRLKNRQRLIHRLYDRLLRHKSLMLYPICLTGNFHRSFSENNPIRCMRWILLYHLCQSK